jgi:hypothetical protein
LGSRSAVSDARLRQDCGHGELFPHFPRVGFPSLAVRRWDANVCGERPNI